MGYPYLNSGESFIITTHHISAGFSWYDMMLTTRHLILVDSSLARFEPNKIPLTTILSVTAAKTATGEPVITLAFTQDADITEQQPRNLLFNQQPGENRKQERDLWIRKLMEQIVIARQQETSGSTQPAAAETPALRPPGSPAHTIEFALPHKSLVSAEPAAVELDVMPEEPDQSIDEMPVQVTIPPDVQPEEEQAELGRAEPSVPPEAPLEFAEEKKTATTEERTVPAEEEETLSGPVLSDAPAGTVPAGDVHQETMNSAPQKKAGLFERLASALRSQGRKKGDVLEEPGASVEQPAAGTAESFMPAAPGMLPGQPETGTPLEEIMERLLKEPPFQEEPVPKEEAAFPPETALELPAVREEELPAMDTSSPIAKEQGVPAIPESGQARPDGSSAGEEPQEPRTPLLSRPKPLMATLGIIALFLIIIALTGGILFFFQSTTGTGQNPVLPPVTPSVTSPSVMTAPQTAVPQTGVWVRVTCNGSYTGWVGNPGNLMHVGGTGDQVYKITDSTGLVQASFEKQDYSGAVLTVEVYCNGTVIHKTSIGAPRGSLDFIIDAKTGEFPGGIPTPTSASGLLPGQIYRY